MVFIFQTFNFAQGTRSNFDLQTKFVNLITFIPVIIQASYFISNLAEKVSKEKENILILLSNDLHYLVCSDYQKKMVRMKSLKDLIQNIMKD